MPTQEQIEDILEKVATYQMLKGASDVAQNAAQQAATRAGAARAQWDSMIASGVDEKMRLGSALIELVESKHELAAKQAAANEAAEETGVAVTVVNDAIDALAQPPAAVAVAAKVEEPSHVAKSRRR